MTSNLSPSPLGDFVMLEPHQIHDLPLRQRSSGNEAEQDQDFESPSDDDLEHISRPGSVRSLNTLSPSSSPSPVTAAEEYTAPSPLNIQASQTLSQHTQSSEEHHQAENHIPTHDGFKSAGDILPGATRIAPQPPSISNTHATLDQEIMDHLIEHALTARIEQEYGHGSSKDKKLRQQMMARFRSLPAEHSFVKGSISQLGGSKALFQGQERTYAELEHVYCHIFTNVERMAMNFLVECHIRHFEKPCHLLGSLVRSGRMQLFHAMMQPGSEEGKLLAMKTQTRVLNYSDTTKPHIAIYDELRWQTRSALNCYTNLRHLPTPHPHVVTNEKDGANVNTNPRNFILCRPEVQIDAMQKIFRDTVADLPNERYGPDNSHISCLKEVPRVMKRRESPEDDTESGSSCLIPPLKKFQPDNSGLPSMIGSSSMPHPAGGAQLVAHSTPTNDQDIQRASARKREYERICAMTGGRAAHGRLHTDAEQQQRVHQYVQAQYQLREQQRKTQEAEEEKRSEQVKIEKLDEQPKQYTFAGDMSEWTQDQETDYEFQLMLLEQHNLRHREQMKKSSKQPEAKKLDESRVNSEEDPMSTRSEQPRDNANQVMATQTSQMKATDWRTFRPGWPVLNNDFGIQSRNALAGGEGSARGYRQDTLLARSTQLPMPPVGGNSKEVKSWDSELSPVGDESLHNASSTSENTRGDFVAPPTQDSGMTINDLRIKTAVADIEKGRKSNMDNDVTQEYLKQMILLQEANTKQERRKNSALANKLDSKPRPVAQAPSNPPTDHQVAPSTSSSQESPEKLVTWTDDQRAAYQMQLMLLEQQNKSRWLCHGGSQERQLSNAEVDKGPYGHQSGRNQAVSPGADEVKTPKQIEYERQLRVLEDANKNRLMQKKMGEHPAQVDNEKRLKALEEANKQRLMRSRMGQDPRQAQYEMQLKALEEANKKRLEVKKMTEQRLQGLSEVTTHIAHQLAQDRPAPISTYGLGAVSLLEYQQKLMEKEQIHMSMIKRQRELDERHRLDRGFSTPSFAPAHYNHDLSKESLLTLSRRDDNGVLWIAFEYTKDDVKMEYTIRCDIEAVNTDALSWSFKDIHCLFELAKGWESTAAQRRRAQEAYLGRVYGAGANGTEEPWSREDNSAESMRQKLADNKIAWSLADLNPCLRRAEGTRTKDLLWTAVKHFKTLQESQNESGKTQPRKSSGPSEPKANDAGPTKDPFILQSPDEIMNDADLEESSSSSEDDDDEECRHMADQLDADSEFPTGFMDNEGTQYLTFEFRSQLTGSTAYYTVRTDDVEQGSHMARPFWHDECICQDGWRQQHSASIHCRDCNIAIALNRLNPVLRGKENEKLRWAAMSEYVLFTDIGGRRAAKLGGKYQLYNGSDGDGPLLNPVVLQKDVEDGYILFMRQPYTGEPGAQCRYCNVILDGIEYGDRVIHLARCDGYERKGQIRMG